MIRFRYGAIHIGAVTENSGVHLGDNFLANRVQRTKESEGIGVVRGSHTQVTGSKDLIVDSDVLDNGRVKGVSPSHAEQRKGGATESL